MRSYVPSTFVMPFGKYAGLSLRAIDRLPNNAGRSYLQWVAGTFADGDVRQNVCDYLAEPRKGGGGKAKGGRKKKKAKKERPRPDESRVGRPTDYGWSPIRPAEPAVDSGSRLPPFEPGIFLMGERRDDITYERLMAGVGEGDIRPAGPARFDILDDRESRHLSRALAEPPPIPVESFPVGAEVEVTRDDGTTETRRVKYAPWQLGHGAWVVGLEGIAGGYALERCRPR